MVIRLSKKLSNKIKEPDFPVIPAEPNPYLDWHAHLFIHRRAQYVMVTNNTSLFSIFMHGAEITDFNKFLDRMSDTLRDTLHDLNADPVFQKVIAPGVREVRFARAQDKSVISSMTDNIFFAKAVLDDEEISPYDLSFEVNKNIHIKTGYTRATELFLGMKTEKI